MFRETLEANVITLKTRSDAIKIEIVYNDTELTVDACGRILTQPSRYLRIRNCAVIHMF
jgi:hypothetical protein